MEEPPPEGGSHPEQAPDVPRLPDNMNRHLELPSEGGGAPRRKAASERMVATLKERETPRRRRIPPEGGVTPQMRGSPTENVGAPRMRRLPPKVG